MTSLPQPTSQPVKITFTVEMPTKGSNDRAHKMARHRRVQRERALVREAWEEVREELLGSGLVEPGMVLRMPLGVKLKARRLAKKAGLDLRRHEAVLKPRFPLDVRLTRISQRKLDPFENLPVALKGVVDELARQFGVDDRKHDLVRYMPPQQEKGQKGNPAVRIEIERREG